MSSSNSLSDLATIAAGLIQKWSSDSSSWSERSVEDGVELDQPKLELALRVLTSVGGFAGLDPGKLAAAKGIAEQIRLVEDAIRHFQSRQKLNKADGILGIRTWKALKAVKACPRADEARKKPLDDLSTASIINSRQTKGWIFYYLDPATVPEKIQGEETHKLVLDAWNLWQEWADFTIRRESSADDANVVINMRSLGDGVGGTLGVAHIGGPSISQQLECTMDRDENWTAEKFRQATCHELGHILGLTHDESTGQLMSPFLDESIKQPQGRDIARIQSIWGARKEIKFVTIDPEDRDVIPGALS